MARLLNEIVTKLQKAFRNGKLVSIVMYGSGAVPDERDYMSDYNILCVLTEVTPVELRDAEPIFRWWREMKNPAPLLLSVEELRTSTDSFPIEFHDIREQHVVLWGEDVVKELPVDTTFYRAQVEYELRIMLLRLRQKAGAVLSDNDLLLRMMAASVATFCVLLRHALWLAGVTPKWNKRDVVAAGRDNFGIAVEPFDTLLDLREGTRKIRSVADPVALLSAYLRDIGVVIQAVDRM